MYVFSRGGRHLRTLDALTGSTRYRFDYDSAGRLTTITDANDRQTLIQRDATGQPTAIRAPDGQLTTFGLTAGFLTSITNPAGETTRFTYTPDGLLTSVTTPRGGVTTFAYNEVGQLVRETNPIGGGYRLEQTLLPTGKVVTIINALGHRSSYETTRLQNGERTVQTAPNGAQGVQIRKRDGTVVDINPDGTVITTTPAPDPRFGMAAPYLKSRLATTSDGTLFYHFIATRTVALANTLDPFSLIRLDEATTENGRTTSLSYLAASRTLTFTFPDGTQRIQTLDEAGRPISELQTGRAPVSYTRDSAGRLTARTEGSGPNARTTTFSYDSAGNLAAITDPLGATTTFGYDAAGRELTRTLPLGIVLETAYDADGNIIRQTDLDGLTTTYEYDLASRLSAKVRDPGGRAVRTEYRYDPVGNLIQVIEDTGSGRTNATTKLSYVPVGLTDYAPALITDAMGATTRYTYTLTGKVATLTTPLGQTITFSYSPADWLTTITSPLGHQLRRTYDAIGQLIAETDPSGVTTRFAYDSAGRLVQVTTGAAAVGSAPAINATTTFDYNIAGQLATITDPLGRTTTRSYDSFGRLVSETDPAGNVTRYEYDAVDRLVALVRGDNQPTERRRRVYTYDSLGRRTSEVVDPDGLALTTRYRYTTSGSTNRWRLQEVEAPQGGITVYRYDSFGNLVSTTDALGQNWQFRYNNLGDLVGQIDPLGRAITITVDARGRRTALQEGNATERWSYRLDGSLASYTDFAGLQTTLSYDADGRLSSISYPAGTASASFSYDGAGRLVRMSDGLGTTEYGYDAAGRLVSRTRNGRTVRYQYDAANQLTSIDYWGRGTVAYRYDSAGRLSGLTPWGTGELGFSWNASGELVGESRPGGVNSTYRSDGAGRLIRLATGTLLDLEYRYDQRGNRVELREPTGTTSYQYDALNRLTQVAYPAAGSLPATVVSYQYDAVGNRIGEVITTTTTSRRTFSYDSQNRLTSEGFQYDANGNLVRAGANRYVYDGANRLLASVVVSGSTVITTSYGYDGLGNLVQQTINGVTTELVLDERSPLAVVLGEVRSDGQEDLLYAYGPSGVAAQQRYVSGVAQGVEYALVDALGSVRALVDASGNATWRASYEAFGQLRAVSGSSRTTLGFTGERMGAVDGTVALRARVLEPTMGRFLQRDVMRGESLRPQSLNRYVYAENNPVRFTDPSGYGIRDVWNWIVDNAKFKASGPTEYKYDARKDEGKFSPKGGIKVEFGGAYDKTKSAEGSCLGVVPVSWVNTTSTLEGKGGASFEGSSKGVTAGLGAEATAYKVEQTATYGTQNFGFTAKVSSRVGSGNAFAGVKDNSLGAKAGFNLISYGTELGFNVLGFNIALSAEVGAKAEVGAQIGARTEVKLPLVSLGFSIGSATPAPKSWNCCS